MITQPQPRFRGGFWLVSLSLFTVCCLAAFFELSSDQAISIIVVGSVFFLLMAFVMSASPTAEIRARNDGRMMHLSDEGKGGLEG